MTHAVACSAQRAMREALARPPDGAGADAVHPARSSSSSTSARPATIFPSRRRRRSCDGPAATARVQLPSSLLLAAVVRHARRCTWSRTSRAATSTSCGRRRSSRTALVIGRLVAERSARRPATAGGDASTRGAARARSRSPRRPPGSPERVARERSPRTSRTAPAADRRVRGRRSAPRADARRREIAAARARREHRPKPRPAAAPRGRWRRRATLPRRGRIEPAATAMLRPSACGTTRTCRAARRRGARRERLAATGRATPALPRRGPTATLRPWPPQHDLLRPRRALARHRRRRRAAEAAAARLHQRPRRHDRLRHVGRLRAAARVDRRASTASTPRRCSSPTARCRPTRSCSRRSSQPGDAVVVEKPTYDRTLLNLRNARRRRAHGRARDRRHRHRRRSRRCSTAASRPKLAHVIPNFQNPAGYTLSPAKRAALLALAARARLRDLRGRPVRRHPLRAASRCRRCCRWTTAGKVVYASSFSKTVCPGIRVGYLVGPADADRRRSRSSRRTRTSRRTWSPSRSSTSSAARARIDALDRDGQGGARASASTR